MIRNLLLFLLPLLWVSCAKLPVQTITLADALAKEGARMHELNVSLLNTMFAQKSAAIDTFMRTQYIPKYIANLQQSIPAGTDISAELPSMLQAIIPQINSRRDEMQRTLEAQRVKLITKLNADYSTYQQASDDLRQLLVSNVNVNRNRAELFAQLQQVSNNRIDLNKVEDALDRFVTDGGNIGEGISNLEQTINNLIKP